MEKIIVTGAAGLVGMNVIARLKSAGDVEIVGIDKHPKNTQLLRDLHPEIQVVEADLATPGDWDVAFEAATGVLLSQAQIGGLNEQEFIDNSVIATRNIVAAMRKFNVRYFVHISSSVVNSKADDFYTRTKTAQEKLIDEVIDIPHIVLRPTLMFGWFDRKHLGWLRRFMDRVPLFPIPGSGKYIRQPLYVGDFANIVISSFKGRLDGTHDISGLEQIYYGDIIRTLRDTVNARARIVHIPYWSFWVLLWTYARLFGNPPFTTSQLKALVIPETFPVTDWPSIFSVDPTPFRDAVRETYLDRTYGDIELEF